MEFICSGRNLCIIEKKAKAFRQILMTENSIGIEEKEIHKNMIHAILYAEDLRNITIIRKDESVYKIALIFESVKEFKAVLEAMKIYFPEMEFSTQNNKINSYTNALVDKLREGINLTIMDTREQAGVKVCPECGMQCDPNIPYCMECGASVE